MNKSTKNLGYGFSALVLSLSAVNLPGIMGAASTSAADYTCGSNATTEVNNYTDLAVALSSGAVNITLCADIDATGGSVDLVATATTTDIDLNGHALIGTLTVNAGKTLNVKDTSEAANGSITATTGKSAVVNAGTLSVTGGVINAVSGKAAISNTGTLTVSGGTINASDTYAITTATNTTTVSGGTVNGAEGQAIIGYNVGEGKALTVSGGTFTGTTLVVNAGLAAAADNSDKIIISGGDFTGVSNLIGTDTLVGEILLKGKISGGAFAINPATYVADDHSVIGGDNFTVVATAANTVNAAKTTFDTTTAEGYAEDDAVISFANTIKANGASANSITIENGLVYTATYKAQGAAAEDIDATTVFTIASPEVVLDAQDEPTTTSTVGITLNENIAAGVYTLTATDLYGNAKTLTFNVAEVAPQLVKDIYTAQASGADKEITLPNTITDAITAYINDNDGIATVAYSSNNEGVATAANGVITVKDGKEGKATITVDFKATAGDVVSSFKFNVYALNTTAVNPQWLEAGKTTDDIDLVDLWGEPTITGTATVARPVDHDSGEDDEEGNDILVANPEHIRITAGDDASISTVTYTAGSDAWVYDGANILGDDEDEEVVPLTKTYTVYSYKVSSDVVNLHYSTTAAEQGEQDLKQLFTLPVNVEADAEAGIDAITFEVSFAGTSLTGTSLTGSTVKASVAADEIDEYTATLTDGTNTGTKDIEVYTYAEQDITAVATQYVEYGDTDSTVTRSDITSNDDSVLTFTDKSGNKLENIEEDENTGDITFIATTNGANKVYVHETLNGEEINEYELTYNVYGMAIEDNDDFYAIPGATTTIAVSDAFGTIAATADGDGVTVSKVGGAFLITATQAGTYEITFTDTLSVDTQTALGTTTVDAFNAAAGSKTISLHVYDSDLIVTSGDNYAVDVNATEATTGTIVDTNLDASTIDFTVEDADGEDVTADFAGVISFTDVTDDTAVDAEDTSRYTKFSVDPAALGAIALGDYTLTFNLVGSDGETILDSEEVTLSVTQTTEIATDAESYAIDLSEGATAEIVVTDNNPNNTDPTAEDFALSDDLEVVITDSEGEAVEGITFTSETELDEEGNRVSTFTFDATDADLEDYTVTFNVISLRDGETVIGTTSATLSVSQSPVATTIASGIYTIKSAMSSSRYLDVNGASDKDGANIQIWSGDADKNANLAQQFYFEQQEDGTYTIMNIKSGKYLDATASGNVVQWTGHGGDNQKWVLLEDADGNISIASKMYSNKVLDVAGGSTAIGTNVLLWNAQDSVNQKFVIAEAEDYVNASELDGRAFSISSYKSSDLVLDINESNGNLSLWSKNTQDSSLGSTNQLFIFIANGDGTYTIQNVATGKVLDIAGGSRSRGANVLQWAAHGGDNQKWFVIDEGDDVYSIRSLNGGLYLDVNGGVLKAGSNIQVWDEHDRKGGNGAQLFKFTEVIGMGASA